MPGTEPYSTRRSPSNGISKSKKQSNGNTKRSLLTIQAIFSAAQAQSQEVPDCFALSRQCSPAPKEVAQASLNATSPPPQVVLFFDHINGNSPSQRSHEDAARYCRSLKDDMSLARSRLQSLLVSRENVTRVAEYAQSWMTLYHGLYSLTYTFRTGFQLVATYERMQGTEVHPVLLSMYLLCLAISLHQAPSDFVIGELSRSDYISQVCDVVEEVIVRKSILAGTVEGLETCMLLLMLAVGRNDLTTICLTLKRLVALADLMGLPQAGNERASNLQPPKSDPYMQAKMQIWEAICATDRNFSMMLKLPASTTSNFFPLHKLVWRDGHDITQSYNYHLARICGMVTSIEKSYTNGDVEEESHRWVVATDNALTNLTTLVPKTWSQSNTGKTTDSIVKFWHQYIKLRTHLRPAMSPEANYQNNRITARNACVEALRIFCSFRTSLPSGFFYCRVLDIQGFTAAILLLLFKDEENIPQSHDDLISRAVGCFKMASPHTTSSFARKAAPGISKLQSFLETDSKKGPLSTTVHIPLLGNVRIERQGYLLSNQSLLSTPPFETHMGGGGLLDSPPSSTLPTISFSIDFENDSPWTPPASRAGGYGRD